MRRPVANAKIAAIVQSRMSSARLPGKALTEVAGQPVLGLLLARLARARSVDQVVVATSAEPEDDRIAAFCRSRGVSCYRGPLDDVAARMVGAALQHEVDVIVRVNGDSPLLDPAIVDRGVELHRSERPDVTTNVRPRSFPVGQSIEIVSTTLLEEAHPRMDRTEREHVMPYFYRHGDRYSIRNFRYRHDASGISLSVDTADDLHRMEAIIADLPDPVGSGLDDLLARARRTGDDATPRGGRSSSRFPTRRR